MLTRSWWGLFKDNLAIMASFDNGRDGLGLEDMITEAGRKRNEAPGN
jgi:hypothetical protein